MAINRNFDSDLPVLGIQRRYTSPQPVPTIRLTIERFVNPLDGSAEMAVDGSSTPVSFRAPVPPNLNALVLRAQFFICDTDIRPSRFGNLAALTNGCNLAFKDAADNEVSIGGQNSAIDASFGYKTCAQWVSSAGTDLNFWYGNGNDDLFTWSYEFSKLGISIELLENEYMEMTINDNLTALDSFQGSLICRLIGP